MELTSAAHVLPPREGEITVTSVSAGSASAAITIANLGAGRYVSIVIDDGAGATSGAYLTSKPNGAPTDPSPTATTGGGRTMFFPADQIAQLVFVPGEQIKVYVPGTGTFYVRQYPSGPA